MLNKYRRLLEGLLLKVFGAKISLNPNVLTLLGLLSALAAALAALATRDPLLTLALVLLSSLLDALDGYVAKVSGRATSFGAFLDSVADRVSDAAFTVSMMALSILTPLESIVLLAAEYMVSYCRARAEPLGVDLRGVGLAERGERVALKMASIAAMPPSPLIARGLALLLAILSVTTAIHRVVFVHQSLKAA